MRKPKKTKVLKAKKETYTKAQLVEHLRQMKDSLQAAQNLIAQMQHEIGEVVALNKSLTRTVENLSKRDC